MISAKLGGILLVTALSTSFQFGFHTGVINAPLKLISDFIVNVTVSRDGSANEAYTTSMVSLCVSGFLIGGFIGAVASGVLANKLGRKKSIIVLALPCSLGCILLMVCQVARSFELIIIGRLLIGLACGAYTAIGPLYMSEIAPVSVRGAAGVLNQLVIVLSLLLSQILGLQELMGTEKLWPYLLGLNILPLAIGATFLLCFPESPRYLYLNKRDSAAAEEALKRLRSSTDEVEAELEEFASEADTRVQKASIFELLKLSHLRLGLIIAILAQFGQQLSGINGLLYYSSELFKTNGLSEAQATYMTIGIGGLLLAITIVSIFVIDRLGRRLLLIGGLFVAFLCLLSFTIFMLIKQYSQVAWPIYPAIVSIYIFICGFGIGPGSIPWFLAAEMFSQETRDAAIAVSVSVNWICNIIVALGFLQMIKYIEVYAFVPSACILCVVILVLYFFMPETKGRSAAAIEAEFRRRTGGRHFTLESDLDGSSSGAQEVPGLMSTAETIKSGLL